jgi:hypothetical protein
MAELQFIMFGKACDEAAAMLEAELSDDGLFADVEHRISHDALAAGHKAVDPVGAATLILAIPSACLAVCDLVDRFQKRRRAVKLIDAARAICTAKSIAIYVKAADGKLVDMGSLDADRLIEIVAMINGPKG